MTFLEQIKQEVLYPVKEAAFTAAFNRRGVTGTDDFDPTDEIDVKDLNLSKADIFTLLRTAPNSISEGGYSISLSAMDKEELKSLAAEIYQRYGDKVPNRPAVRAKSVW